MLDRVGKSPAWIGATDQKKEGSWEWTDCRPFNFTGWVTGEPAVKATANCVELYKADKDYKGWNGLDCSKSLDFVCTKTVCSGKQ